jgi:hypothetical protein
MAQKGVKMCLVHQWCGDASYHAILVEVAAARTSAAATDTLNL